MSAYLDAIRRLVAGEDLGLDLARRVMGEIMDGALEPSQIGAFLAALACKGETADELTGFAMVLRERAVPVDAGGDLFDSCGTGGSGLSTPNTSTMVAFILAAAGVRVAKHGNRSSTGRCGSADVLEQLGVNIDVGPEAVRALIGEVGIAFMLAPRFHPAMRHAGPVRRQVGFRTAFNFLGPLANPAAATRQLLGVSDPQRALLMAEALVALGTETAWIVHGGDGLDEITLTGPTSVWKVDATGVVRDTIDPTALGLDLVPLSAIEGGDPAHNAAMFRDVLTGHAGQADRTRRAIGDLVVLNAAAGLVVAGVSESLDDGLVVARATIASGAATAKLEAYRDASKRFSP